MDEHILEAYIVNAQRHTEQAPVAEWVSLPTTGAELHEVFEHIGVDGGDPEQYAVVGYASPIDALAERLQPGASLDELNYLASLLERQRDEDRDKFAAAVAHGDHAGSVADIINLTHNLDCYWLYPTVHNSEDYGHYLVNELDEPELPESAKKYFDYKSYGRDAVQEDGGSFTDYGYIYNNKNDYVEWYKDYDVPQEYRIAPQEPTRLDPEKMDYDAIGTRQSAVTTVTPPLPVTPLVLTGQNNTERMKEITDRLEAGIQALFDSDQYAAYLKAMSKFHNYSFNNTLLIVMQKPDASLIAGFSKWKTDFDRNVKKGEKGIKILAPAPFKVKKDMERIDPKTQRPVVGRDGKPVTEEVEVTIPAFKPVTVFDISQTEGKDVPDISVDALTGDVEQYKDFFAALEKTSPVPVAFEAIDTGANGYYHQLDKRIAIKEGMSELQTVKTAIHEIAHAKLHAIDKDAPEEEQPQFDRRTREVQAESVAYTVCQHYGLDTSDYSFGYVAGWSSGREVKELKASLETIRAAANELITKIDGHFAELQQQREAAEQSDTYFIYQLKGGEETRDYRFESLDRLQARGLAVNRDNYELVYSAPLHDIDTLEDIYRKFNQDHPADFTGHSLSVSDVVVLTHGDRQTAHYCDSYGFTKVPQFLQEQQKELVPDAFLTGDKIQTPRGNFSLASMSIEQMKAAGYSFHHSSEDGKYDIMASNNRAFAVAVEPPEKSNPLKTAELSTEQNENMLDGRINNTPSVGELEAKVKAGETISLTDLAAAVKNERKAERGKPPKKPSIRAQLKADKEAQSKKQAVKTKTNNLEV